MYGKNHNFSTQKWGMIFPTDFHVKKRADMQVCPYRFLFSFTFFYAFCYLSLPLAAFCRLLFTSAFVPSA